MSSFFSSVTELGGKVDFIQFWLILLMVFWFVACNAVMIYLMLRYRERSPDQKTSPIKGSHTLEFIWTVVPTIIVALIFLFGVGAWSEMRTMPTDEDRLEISVTGQKWSWSYKYPDGRVEASDMYVPQGKPVVLKMRSVDVLHSFFIPEFRVKEDVVPSIYTYLWFKADVPGSYQVFCTEYCGDNHSAMLGKVHVLSPEDWQKYMKNELFPVLTPVEEGEQLYVKRACVGCHSKDGSPAIGPTFQGLMGREEEMADGTMIVVDDNYLVESIKYPNRKLVKGYPAGQMPSYDGQLTDEQIENIIAFIKTLQ